MYTSDPDRERLRAHRSVFWEAWRKAEAGLPLTALEVRIARVVAMHPEYHSLFEDKESFLDRDFGLESGVNPYLHMSLHLALEEQFAMRQPPQAAACLEYLMRRKGFERHEALHRMLEVLAETVYFAQRRGGEPDTKTYVAALEGLMK